MHNDPARRRKINTKDLDERIAELVLRILLQAALDAHGRTRMDAWEDFRQN